MKLRSRAIAWVLSSLGVVLMACRTDVRPAPMTSSIPSTYPPPSVPPEPAARPRHYILWAAPDLCGIPNSERWRCTRRLWDTRERVLTACGFGVDAYTYREVAAPDVVHRSWFTGGNLRSPAIEWFGFSDGGVSGGDGGPPPSPQFLELCTPPLRFREMRSPDGRIWFVADDTAEDGGTSVADAGTAGTHRK